MIIIKQNSKYNPHSKFFKDGPKIQTGIQAFTQDNFFKKMTNSKGFLDIKKSELNGTIINRMKSDLFQLQEMINENAHLTKMYKLLSKSPVLRKKLTEIEEGMEINVTIEKLPYDSCNAELLGKKYNCKSMSELVEMLSLEVSYFELFLKKLMEYFLLLHLKFNGDDNLYQDSFSKIFIIKLVMEKLIESKLSQSMTDHDKFIIDDYTKFIQISSLNELINNHTEESKLTKHVQTLISEELSIIVTKFSNLLTKISNDIPTELNCNNFDIENFDLIINNIEKIISDKNTLLTSLQNELNEIYRNKQSIEEELHFAQHELQTAKNQLEIADSNKKSENVNEFETEISSLKKQLTESFLKQQSLEEEVKSIKSDLLKVNQQWEMKEIALISKSEIEISKLKKELNECCQKRQLVQEEFEKLRTTLEMNSLHMKESKNKKDIFTESTKEILQLIEEKTKDISQLQDEKRNRLEKELEDLTKKYARLNEQMSMLAIENQELKKKIESLCQKRLDPTCYEHVLLEQFNTMKYSYQAKLENLSSELSQAKVLSRRKIADLEEDLKETKTIKDIFLRQIIDLQKKLKMDCLY